MKNLVLLLLFSYSSISFAQMPERIELLEFNKGTLAEIQKMAKNENKSVFVLTYTKGCPACKILKKHVLTDDTLVKYFNEHFVSTKVNMTKAEGQEYDEKYEIRAYPTLLFLDLDGNVLLRIVGSVPPEEILEALAKIMNE